jgi:acetyl-CoA carboxylase biotin carboxyl carrier protein
MARGPQKSDSPKGGALIDDEAIHNLARLLNETGLTEIEIEQDGRRLRVARAAPGMPGPAAPRAAEPTGAPAAAVSIPASTDFSLHPGVVSSPMVGTAYRSSEPGAKQFVDIGSTVKTGDVLLIIEAMKTMNQIPAPHSGTVTQILFEDGQPVEFAQPLVIIE